MQKISEVLISLPFLITGIALVINLAVRRGMEIDIHLSAEPTGDPDFSFHNNLLDMTV
jgi:hypothetical protein